MAERYLGDFLFQESYYSKNEIFGIIIRRYSFSGIVTAAKSPHYFLRSANDSKEVLWCLK